MSTIDFKVGDLLKLTREIPPHGVIGDVFTVVRKVDDTTAEMDRCGCPDHVLKNEFFRRAYAPFSQVGASQSDGGDIQLAGRDHQLRKVGKAYRVDENYEGEGM